MTRCTLPQEVAKAIRETAESAQTRQDFLEVAGLYITEFSESHGQQIKIDRLRRLMWFLHCVSYDWTQHSNLVAVACMKMHEFSIDLKESGPSLLPVMWEITEQLYTRLNLNVCIAVTLRGARCRRRVLEPGTLFDHCCPQHKKSLKRKFIAILTLQSHIPLELVLVLAYSVIKRRLCIELDEQLTAV